MHLNLSPIATYFLLFLLALSQIHAVLEPPLDKFDWLVGEWRSEFSGKVFWPTVPTMTYGEILTIQEAPLAKSSGVKFLNFSARAWSHSTKDHFHDEWGFLTADANGTATLMTAGNNGFTTYEAGPVTHNKMVLNLKDIGRITFSRDLPVEDLKRTFIRHDDLYLEQVVEMRTATHPKTGRLEHLRVIYTKDYVSVPGDNPDCDLLPPPYVQYAGIFRPTPFVPTNNNGTPSAAGTSVGNDFSGGAPRSAIQSPQHQVYGHSPSGDQGGLPVNFGTVPRIQHERQQQQPVFFEEYHGRLVAPNGDIYYATTSGGSPAQSHPPVASGGAATPSILTRPDHPCLHEVPTSSGAIPTSAGITPGYHEYLVPNRPYVPTMASGPGSTALETVVEVQTPDTPRSMCNSNANGAGQLYARHGQWANFQPRDTVITSLRGPPGGQQENLVRKISPTENGTPSSTDV